MIVILSNIVLLETEQHLPMPYSAGTSVGTDNSNITISNNNIYNYFSATASSNGIFIGSNLSLDNNK
jgi:hypothetical protein